MRCPPAERGGAVAVVPLQVQGVVRTVLDIRGGGGSRA